MTITRNPREAALEAVAEAAREYRRTSFTTAREDLDDALDALDALPAADGGWRPIETALKNGTPIRVLTESEVEWREPHPSALISGGWHRVSEKDKVIGWQPVPQSAEEPNSGIDRGGVGWEPPENKATPPSRRGSARSAN